MASRVVKQRGETAKMQESLSCGKIGKKGFLANVS